MTVKPLGRKAYGSIPHLPDSRLGPRDYSCHEGQARICTASARDKHDRIIVTEKLDGGCVAVARCSGEIIALGRAGFLASTSPYEQHHVFSQWVTDNEARFSALPEGDRIVGEWIYLAHGTLYKPIAEPFIPFDVMTGKKRWLHDDARELFSTC